MSWEGYYQCLCEDGHLSIQDGWAFYEDDNVLCHCGKKIVWTHTVDQTNDSGHPYTNFVEIEPKKTKTCPTCGHTETIGETRYRAPIKEEMEEFNARIQNEAEEV